ncbi:MAG: T9SS type A sorting domain-containing protein, partial [Bacteroidales bacterium]
QLKVYPNPSVNGLFYLSKGETTHTYSVFDLFGREILKAGANTHSLDLSQYAKGMYLLQVITPKGVGKTIKLLKN